jgi:hypothetical protein
MIVKSKNTERIRKHNVQTADIKLLGQHGGRIYLSVSDETNQCVYMIDEESFLKHFIFTTSVDDIPACDPHTFKESGIQIVKI